MINGVKEAIADQAVRKDMIDPYSICPESHTYKVRQANPDFEYDKDFYSWVGPFVMASINTRVVFRSNSIADYIYGMQFRYDEATLTGNGNAGRRRARQLYWGIKLFGAAVAVPPIRWLLEKCVLPKPGEGPSLEKQTSGSYQLDFIGRTADGLVIKTRVEGDRDPGYGSTGKMLAQAGLCLAFDVYPDQLGGGFWTPATAFNDKLIQRLQAHAGIQFSTQD